MEAIREKNGVQDNRLDSVEKKCEMSEIAISGMGKDVAEIKTNLSWVMKIQWALITLSIGSIVAALVNLFFSIAIKK